MGTYRKEWPCCGSVTKTECWEPETCPFCEPAPTAAPEQVAQGADERALFEAWFTTALRKTYPHMHDDSAQRKLWQHDDGTYMDLQTQHDWSVWKAARAVKSQPSEAAPLARFDMDPTGVPVPDECGEWVRYVDIAAPSLPAARQEKDK